MLDEPATPAEDPEVEAIIMAILGYATRTGIVLREAQGGSNDRYSPIDAWFVRRWLAAGGTTFALRTLAAFPRLDSTAGQLSEAGLGDAQRRLGH